MRTKSLIIGLLLILFLGQEASSQIRSKYLRRFRSREVSFSIGATNLIGELGGANRIGSEAFSLRDFDFPAVRPTIGGGYGFQILNRASLKTNLVIGYMRGNDKFTQYASRRQRNINYRSILIEFSQQFEYMLTQGKQTRTAYNLRMQRKKFSLKNIPFTTYLFAGVGFFYFNPQNMDKHGVWRNVKQYHTEGEGFVPTRKNYSLFQFCIPMGIGIKYPLGKGYSLGFEYGFRKTFTDYLDDASMTYFDEDFLRQHYGQVAVDLSNPASKEALLYLRPGQQRGDPRDKDFYLFALISIYRDLSRVSRIRNFRF
ncbi:MAG: DUF6089 family protein [Bacteroidetes bacterium]|nr:DUF6089 family protein [Bacteroidota bacterium]